MWIWFVFIFNFKNFKFLFICFFILGVNEYKILFNRYYIFLNVLICFLNNNFRVGKRKKDIYIYIRFRDKYVEGYLEKFY